MTKDHNEMTENHGQARNTEDAQCGPRSRRERRAGADTPLVSVVIPCYKQAHFLGEAIESVLAQTYPRFEVIVVDDGSPDDTSEVATRYPRVRCIRQRNQGLSAARNTGLRGSKGSYVLFLDADDRLLPEALEIGLEHLNAHPGCAFVHGRWKDIAADGSFVREAEPHRPDGDDYAALLQQNYIVMHGAVMYRRAVFESVGDFDTSLRACEDYDHYLRVARKFPICYHGKVVFECRRHGANMTRDSALMLSTAVDVLSSQWKYVKESERYKEAYKTGVRLWGERYGDLLVDEVRDHVREREWKRVARGTLVLLRYYPRGFTLLDERCMERHRLAKQLRKRKQELQAREQQLRELDGALAEEHQEVVRQLRRRIQRITLRAQKMDRQAQNNGLSYKTWKSLKRVGHLRARVLRR